MFGSHFEVGKLVAAWRSTIIIAAVAMITEVVSGGQTGAGRTVFDLAA